MAELERFLHRVAMLTQSLPDQAAQNFKFAVASELTSKELLPTETGRLVRQRIG